MPLSDDYDPRREAEGLERRETVLQREDREFELRRYWPAGSWLGTPYEPRDLLEGGEPDVA